LGEKEGTSRIQKGGCRGMWDSVHGGGYVGRGKVFLEVAGFEWVGSGSGGEGVQDDGEVKLRGRDALGGGGGGKRRGSVRRSMWLTRKKR